MADPTPYNPARPEVNALRRARSVMPGVEVSEAPMLRSQARQFGVPPERVPFTPRGVEVTELGIDPRRPGSAPTPARARGPAVGEYRLPEPSVDRGSLRGMSVSEAPMTPAQGKAFGVDVPEQKPASYRAGQAVARTLRGQGGGAGRAGGVAGVLAGSAMGSVADSMQTPTENYRRRLGMQTDDPSLAGDLLARGVGVVSDLGASILDTPVALANGVSRMFGGEGSLRLPGGNFGEILRRNDSPADAQVYADAAPTLRPTSTATTSAMPAPQVASAAQAAAPAIQSGGDTPEILALRARQRDAQTQADLVQGQQMEAARRAAEAENVAGNAQALRVAQSQTARMEAERARRDADTQASSIQQQTALRGMQKLKEIDNRDLQGVRNQGAMDVAGLQADTLRRGQDLTADTTRRGQDLELEGRQLDSAAKRAQLRYQMGKDERDFAAQRGDASFTQNQAARKAAEERIDRRFTGADGKVDTAAANQYKAIRDSAVDFFARRAEAAGDATTAKALRERGYVMDAEDEALIEQAYQSMLANTQTAGRFNPFAGTPQGSTRFEDWLPVDIKKNIVGSNEVVYAGGGTTRINDLRGAGPTTLWGATTRMNEPTITAAQQAALRREQQGR